MLLEDFLDEYCVCGSLECESGRLVSHCLQQLNQTRFA